MALMPFRKKAPPVKEPPPRKSLTAAAVNLLDKQNGSAAWHARRGEDDWQRNAWHYYDTIGELNAAVRWVANAVSMTELYAAEIDPETGLITEATDNDVVQMVTNSILGGPEKRSQAQSHMAINWLIAGEMFVVVRPTGSGKPDEWLILSSTEVEERGGSFRYVDPFTGKRIELSPRDLFARVWSPHPRMQSHADSSVRSALPILREVERTSMNIMARLDSRLAGAGILLVPEEMDFPAGDDSPADVQGFVDLLRRAAEASLRDPGSSSSQVPLIVPAPGDLIQNGAFEHLSFTTELSQEIVELRTSAIRRLAMALDIPAEIMTGMGESSHWNAWQIEETTFKIHVAPLLDKLSDALTEVYLRPTLRAMGVADPERYVLAFNTTEIVTRPDRFTEMNVLFDKGLISPDFLRSELGIPDDAIPSRQEELRRIAITLVTGAPTLIEVIPQLAEMIGFDAPEPAPVEAGGQPPAPTEEQPRALPERPDQGDEGPGDGLTAAAELMVYDALSRAGGRLLTREHRGQFSHVPKHELYTVIRSGNPVDLLEGSFQFVDAVAPAFGVDPGGLRVKLRAYCVDRIATQSAHDREAMRSWLNR